MYDVVILNLPGPSTLQANRYYTIEFFKLIKKKLSPGAVLSFGLQAPPNYLNSEAIDLNSTLFATLKGVFQNVIIIPGEKNYFLASNAPLTYNIALAVQKKGLDNKYVNQFYFDDALLKSRGETILAALNPAAEINGNLNPISYHQQLAYWLSQFKGKYWLMGVVIGVLALFVLFSGSTPSKAMFLTGFTATGMEILLLFGLQIFFGNIYLLTSFVFTGFMLGLAIGSFFGKSLQDTTESKYLPVTQLLIGGLVLASSVLFVSSGIAELPQAIVYALYLVVTIMIGGLTGFQFRQASLYRVGSSAEISGKTYSYDLFGSALGALTVSLYLVPKIGIVASIVTISLVNLIFGLWLILRKNLLI
jgi:spermidine synthase